MKTKLRMKCSSCGHWNRFEVVKHFIEHTTLDPKVGALIPYYEALKEEKCSKCKRVTAKPKELIRIFHNS